MTLIPPENNKLDLNIIDFMLLSKCDSENAKVLSTMITAVKKRYVLDNHPYAITMIATGNKAGKYKTYVGKPRKEIIRNTEEKLFDFLSDYYLEIEEKKHTFGSLLESMLSDLVDENNRSLQTVSTYSTLLKSMLPDEFLQRPVIEITESEIKTLIVNQTKKLNPKPDRLRKSIQLINRVFLYGVSRHICQNNPAQFLDVNSYLSNCNTKKKKAEEKEFSDEEIELITADMLRTPQNPRALMVLLAIQTGMRRGELCALHWEDIEDEYIHIHRQQLKDLSKSPKTPYEVQYTKDEREHPHDGRRFPITPEIQKILDLAKQLNGKSDYIFHDGDSWILKDGYSRFLLRRCSSLGITTTNNHAFRIALNNKFIRLGLSADERALLLGHSVEVNERFYSKYDSRRLTSISAKLM